MSPLHSKRDFPFSLALRIRTTYMFLQREQEDTTCSYYHTHSYKRLTHTYPSNCRIPPSLIRSISSIFPSTVLRYSNIYFPLPSYALISRKFAKGAFLSEPELSIKISYGVMHCLKTRSSRTSATGGHLDRV